MNFTRLFQQQHGTYRSQSKLPILCLLCYVEKVLLGSSCRPLLSKASVIHSITSSPFHPALPDLIVSHALPVRCRLGDGEKGRAVEQQLFVEMEKLSLSLVGW